VAFTTANYGWKIPELGEDPWIDTINSLFLHMEETIATVAGVVQRPAIHTNVISFYPEDTCTLASAPAWTTVWSSGGAAMGSFDVQNSGSIVNFDMRFAPRCHVIEDGYAQLCYRIVVLDGTNTFTVPNDSGWAITMQDKRNTWAEGPLFYAPWGVLSLAAGSYSCVVQTYVDSADPVSDIGADAWYMGSHQLTPAYMTLDVYESGQAEP